MEFYRFPIYSHLWLQGAIYILLSCLITSTDEFLGHLGRWISCILMQMLRILLIFLQCTATNQNLV